MTEFAPWIDAFVWYFSASNSRSESKPRICSLIIEGKVRSFSAAEKNLSTSDERFDSSSQMCGLVSEISSLIDEVD